MVGLNTFLLLPNASVKIFDTGTPALYNGEATPDMYKLVSLVKGATKLIDEVSPNVNPNILSQVLYNTGAVGVV